MNWARDMTRLIESRGITDPRVLAAMRNVPRHEFVSRHELFESYDDHPLPIGFGQTISQPYIVAYMCDIARLTEADRVLEIGTGSGYHAAVIGQLVQHVYSVEIIPELAERARKTVGRLGYGNISIRTGDGYHGWADEAPFDAVIVTACSQEVPPPLVAQLAEGGRIVIPVGAAFGVQSLILGEKRGNEIAYRETLPVQFVPLTGEHRKAGVE